MGFIRNLIGRKRNAEPAIAVPLSSRLTDSADSSAVRPATDPRTDALAAQIRSGSTQELLTKVTEIVRTPEPKPVNIWDMDDDTEALPAINPDRYEMTPDEPESVLKADTPRATRRPTRTKTRLIGFDKSDGDVVDLFNPATKAAASVRAQFPVGWIVVTDGPGRGECFALGVGMSQIGRGEDQAVQLDFGDSAISRTNHAAIVYDPKTHQFHLGHGGKANIVRINDKPLISNEMLKTGDMVQIGETTLRFAAFCDETFNWAEAGREEEHDDVAIA